MLHSRSDTPTAVLVVALLPAGQTSTATLSATARPIRPLMPEVSAGRRRAPSPERRARPYALSVGSLGMAARAVMLGCVAAVVLGVAYVIVAQHSSAPTLTPVVREPPVKATVEPATVLGKGRAALASG